MKRAILFGLCALTLLFTVDLMGASSPPASVEAGLLKPGPPPLERFVKPLALSSEQQSKLRPIFEQARTQAAQDLNDANADGQPDGRRPTADQMAATLKMREADFRVRLAAVLTPAQMAQYEQLTTDASTHNRTLEGHPAHGHRDSDSVSTAK
jgi:Spy/CpxP family protein refolding chaperone